MNITTPATAAKPAMLAYHRDIGFPKSLVLPDLVLKLHYTRHALQRRQRDDKYERLNVLPGFLRVNPRNIVEAYVASDDNIRKLMVRTHYDNANDIVLVLEVFPGKDWARVVTMYLNKKGDSHKTLNQAKYDQPAVA